MSIELFFTKNIVSLKPISHAQYMSYAKYSQTVEEKGQQGKLGFHISNLKIKTLDSDVINLKCEIHDFTSRSWISNFTFEI